MTEPGCSTVDGTGPAVAGQQRHPPVQQSVGLAGGHGEEEGW